MSYRKATKSLLNNSKRKSEIFISISMTSQLLELRKFRPRQIMTSNLSNISWRKTSMKLTSNVFIFAVPVKISTIWHMHWCSKSFQMKSLFQKSQASLKIYWKRLKDGLIISFYQEHMGRQQHLRLWERSMLILHTDWVSKSNK